MKKIYFKRWLAAAIVGTMFLTGTVSAAAVDADPVRAAIEDNHECSIQGHIDMTYDDFKTAAADGLKALDIDLGALSGLNVTLTRGRELNEYSVLGVYMNVEKQSTYSFVFDAKSGRMHSFIIIDQKYEDAAAKAEVTLRAIGFTDDEIKDTMKKLESSDGRDPVESKGLLLQKATSEEHANIEIKAQRSESADVREISEESKPQCVRDIEGLIASAKVSSYPTQFELTFAQLAEKTGKKLKKEGFDYEQCSSMYKLSDLRGRITGDAAVYAYQENDKGNFKTEVDYDPATTKINYIQISDETAERCLAKLDIFLEALGVDEKTRTTAEDDFIKAAEGKNTEDIPPIPAGDYVLDVRVGANSVTVGIGKE